MNRRKNWCFDIEEALWEPVYMGGEPYRVVCILESSNSFWTNTVRVR